MGVQKVRRQQAAAVRQQARTTRTPEQQLALLDKSGLVAKKERAKLKKQIEASKAKSTKDKQETPNEQGDQPAAK